MHEELQAGFETGNVRLVRRIGAGGMGTVWLADHTTLRTRVAVKFVTDGDLAGDAIALERFAREAELLARLKSPHIVQVLDRAMTNSGIPYLVLELLEGETLSRHVARHRGASLSVTRRVVEHVGRALVKAHALGVVHRDVKPDNIYLARGDDGLLCKIFDFGIAKEQGAASGRELTTSGAMVGTPSYMSPEQFADSSAADEHVDRWALAVVAYLCLTGERPFAGRDLVELCRNVLRGNYEPPSRRAGESDPVPARVDAWFARAFAPRRGERFDTTTEMVAAFLDALGDLGREEPEAEELEPDLSPASLRGAASKRGRGRRAARSSRSSAPPSWTQASAEPAVPTPPDDADPLALPADEPTQVAPSRASSPLGGEEATRVTGGADGSTTLPTVDLGRRQVRRLVGAAALVTALALALLAGRAERAATSGRGADAVDPGRTSPRAAAEPARAPRPEPSPRTAPALDEPPRASATAPSTSASSLREPDGATPAASGAPRASTTPSAVPAASSPPRRKTARPADADLDYDHGF